MASFEINEQLLRESIKELIAMDEELNVSQETINAKIADILADLAESPEEIIAGVIVDEIYYDAIEEDTEDENEVSDAE